MVCSSSHNQFVFIFWLRTKILIITKLWHKKENPHTSVSYGSHFPSSPISESEQNPAYNT
uniref:Uncharacterized protein n=1 Tax=Octopus bimaculoides TaxID=37653 RepID=A0A0L8FG66_OCTBM